MDTKTTEIVIDLELYETGIFGGAEAPCSRVTTVELWLIWNCIKRGFLGRPRLCLSMGVSGSRMPRKSPFNTIANQSQFQCFSRPCTRPFA